jgi:hypothetical protein
MPGLSAAAAARNIDLLLVVVALPVFLLAGLPIAGYLVAAAAWLVGRGLKLAADRRSMRSLAEGDRAAALRPQAIATLSRVWIVTGAVLVTGLIDRESGLAAAVLAVVLFTAHLLGLVASQVIGSEGER